MGTYEVICATRHDCEQGSHITDVSVSRKKEIEHVAVSVVRLMLSSGDTVYVRDQETNNRIGIRKGRCACGVKTLKTDVDGSAALDSLDACG